MPQYNAMPSPGPYVPPSQAAPAQQQGAQPPTNYRPIATGHGASNQSQKGGGGFGQMINQRLDQAVTTGKPMLNKLGKTISSKLGNKPSGGPPQHLQSYQNYQSHYGQQQQGQAFSPQPQPQQWGQQQQHQPPPQAPNGYPSSQQSPYQQSNYSTPTSGHSGQNNYFPQQTTQAPSLHSYAPQSPLTAPGQTSWQYSQGGGTTEQAHTQGHTQGHIGQGHAPPGQFQTPAPPQTQSQNQYVGQQMGVVGGSYVPQHTPPPPHTPGVSPGAPAPPMPSQWGQPGTGQLPPATTGQQSGTLAYSPQQNASATSPPMQQYQWTSPSPVGSHGLGQPQTLPHSNSPPPAQPTNASPQVPPNKPVEPSQPSPPASHHVTPHSAPTEFIAELPAELPADMGNLSLVESKPQESVSGSQYQAFRPSVSQTGSPSPCFTIPRRSLSASTVPLADPWRFADPATEVPTREFYMLADLLFDALDRKFEPRNTGLLEAPKIIGSWVKLTEDACRLFSYRSYSAFAKMWSLEGIPHIMVPCQSDLAPNWNFSQHTHAQEVKVRSEVPTPVSTYTTYMPALNRAGWYKFFFLEVMHAPEDIGDLIPALCADTYRPGVLNQPDLNKRDKSGIPGLQMRAAEIQTYAIGRVCEETKVAMAADPNVALAHTHPTAPASGSAQTSPEDMADMAVRMHKMQTERQQNDKAAWAMLGLQPKGYPGGGHASLA
ncbi:hypothetical protein G6011_09418 [Alternaria panax]|uniref:PAT1 multi-domain protein n=1 Tax=Alternaria panax TaxID=48097 RepID=A0AAD4IB02_9PLEO|nr:hypothetical protein G6011_09418 [Alternaria panax]